jgi:broad specificity phosphatase PhoE
MFDEVAGLDGELHPLQQAFVDHDRLQCGYCTPSPLRRAVRGAVCVLTTLAALIALSACATGTDHKSKHGVPPLGAASEHEVPVGTLVMIIRHGEKPDDNTANLPGIDASGNPNDHALTQTGWNRAYSLVNLFDPASGRIRPGLATPKYIYAAGATDDGQGLRTRETIQPLAEKLGVQVNTQFGKDDEERLVDDTTSHPGPTLISWQHGEIPTIAEDFGNVSPTPPRTWPDNRADVIWTLTKTATGWNFAQLPELVLPQDQNSVIQQ